MAVAVAIGERERESRWIAWLVEAGPFLTHMCSSRSRSVSFANRIKCCVLKTKYEKKIEAKGKYNSFHELLLC